VKVVVSHVYSRDNAGDAALLSVLIDDLRSIRPDMEIVVLTLDLNDLGKPFDGCPVRPSFMFHALNRFRFRPRKFAYCAWVMASTLLNARTGGRWRLPDDLSRVMDSYRDADLVVGVGGGYLRGKPGLASTTELALLLHPLVLAHQLDKPVVLYTQSVGPFGNRVQTVAASKVLRSVDLILVREDVTVSTLEALGVSTNVVRSVDGGFAFTSDARIDLRDLVGAPDNAWVVGVTVRRWLPAAGQARYEDAFAQLCDWVIDRYGATVVFIPQVTSDHHGDDDRIPARRVAALMRHDPVVLEDKYDHGRIKALYRELDMMVGTRFHSVIFALTARVPALAIEYEHKTTGIMRDLGLERWVMDIAAVDGGPLIARFDALVAARSDYVAQLEERLPLYQRRARETRDHLRRFVGVMPRDHDAEDTVGGQPVLPA